MKRDKIGIIEDAEKYDKEWLKMLIKIGEKLGYKVYPIQGKWLDEKIK